MEFLFIPLLAAVILMPPAWLILWGYRRVYLELGIPERRDFRIGFLAAILINALLAGAIYIGKAWTEARGVRISQGVTSLTLLTPWVINGGLLVYALRFRPKMATGMFALFGLLIVWGVLSSCLFLVGCIMMLVVLGSLGSP